MHFSKALVVATATLTTLAASASLDVSKGTDIIPPDSEEAAKLTNSDKAVKTAPKDNSYVDGLESDNFKKPEPKNTNGDLDVPDTESLSALKEVKVAATDDHPVVLEDYDPNNLGLPADKVSEKEALKEAAKGKGGKGKKEDAKDKAVDTKQTTGDASSNKNTGSSGSRSGSSGSGSGSSSGSVSGSGNSGSSGSTSGSSGSNSDNVDKSGSTSTTASGTSGGIGAVAGSEKQADSKAVSGSGSSSSSGSSSGSSSNTDSSLSNAKSESKSESGSGGDSRKTVGSSPFHSFSMAGSMIIFSEIGDKTFLIAALMAMKHPRVTVFTAAFASLVVMTVLSALMGHALPSLLPKKLTSLLAAGLFIVFGIKLLREGLAMDSSIGVEEELEEVETEIEAKELSLRNDELESGTRKDGSDLRRSTSSPKVYDDGLEKGSSGIPFYNGRGHHRPAASTWSQFAEGVGNLASLVLSPVWVQVFVMTFLGEWGDRSQVATIAMAAGSDYWFVILGAIFGHAICTLAAVVGGKLLASKISLRHITLAGAVSFLVFAIVYFREGLTLTWSDQ
ncbi:Gdt1p [Sugiyamaella lignohabitans]|uniref:Gdt1p n=1 Tax=Sugiyamaella lignohabitans TaxID=796027 RepID=A0A167CWG0_9ASCO|nr:Gdt1p [Sugiyamaella lignohabitans]ANB12184.1 Gdt1p [Sugiyamaella lignohabitans]